MGTLAQRNGPGWGEEVWPLRLPALTFRGDANRVSHQTKRFLRFRHEVVHRIQPHAGEWFIPIL